MKLLKEVLLFAACFLVLGSVIDNHAVHAQAAAAWSMQGQGPHTTCLTPAAGAYILCPATDGIWISNNGAAYFQLLAPVPAGGMTSITINGTTKTGATPSFTLTTPSTVTAN